MLFFKEDVLGSEEAFEILSPHLDTFSLCIDTGFGDLAEIGRELKDLYSGFSGRTCCCIVNDMMIRAAKELFSGASSNIKMIDALGSKVVLISDKIIVRFKKLDERLHPQNHQSQQQDAVNQQLFWPDHTVVTAGYRLSREHGTIRDKHIVCWLGDQLIWEIQLPDHPAQMIPIVTHPSTAPQAVVKAIRTKAKKTGTVQ